MKTKEKILDKWLEGCECSRKHNYIDDHGVYGMIECAMEEHARQMYNQAIEDAAKNAEIDIIYNPISSTTYCPATIKSASICFESILKLKK